ncbi:hypothetical protein H9W91_17500 [Streptomyces alfalfae]|uniref:hypothetical protein n=1 Tax=Streptomyces alfalfae TaxID=1642299 RepID=UPI001BA80CCC|nr:hypothetical protein [Streptomyces alfalfae]QUI32457.1 hypothetical protein H9W91_17500 [Streptomyces alfalfae]
MTDLSMPAPQRGTTPTRRLIAAGVIRRAPAAEPSDLAVAVRLGEHALDSHNPAATREALRILIRAVLAQGGAR